MRQFLLGKNAAYGNETDFTQLEAGVVEFVYNNDGVPTVSNDGAGLDKEFMLVLGRDKNESAPVVLPIYNNKFSFVKSTYLAAKQFHVSFVVPAPTTKGDYSVIIAKKGMDFNERNKWTATVHVTDTAATHAQELSDALVKAINGQGNHGVTASNSSSTTLTIKGNVKGEDYEVIPCDLLTGLKVSVTTHGDAAVNDAKMINDMYCKAAADAGIEYTYQDAVRQLYPEYPFNALRSADAADVGFTVFTLKFAEPRLTKTTDEVVNQIVQVAFPTGAAAIATFETVCEGIVNGGHPVAP